MAPTTGAGSRGNATYAGLALDIPLEPASAVAAAAQTPDPKPQTPNPKSQTLLPSASPPAARSSLAATLFLAFVGGLILNLMPCVFPVLGIKILGFVNQSGHNRKKVTLHGLTFALGVVGCAQQQPAEQAPATETPMDDHSMADTSMASDSMMADTTASH